MAAASLTGDALPPLREELRLVGRSRDPRGEAVWLAYDPLTYRYLELKPLAYEIFSRWMIGSAAKLIEVLRRETPYRIGPGDMDTFVQYLRENQLLRGHKSPPPAKGHPPWVKARKLLTLAVFFRLRLLRPDAALGQLARSADLFFSRGFWLLTAVLGVSGLMLVIRQWDVFAQTFTGFLDVRGMAVLLTAIVFSKIVHELGHALTAKRLGCRVPAMGLAFILGMPLAYTDVSDTWRLVRRRDRLMVSAGGILAETALAVFATWGWLILPEGPARGACFVVAATGWVATLIVNLNPFMRFDGYYMLSDVLGIRNPQTRSFRMGKWALRRLLFGWSPPSPEPGTRRFRAFLTGFAWLTWSVRAAVFFGLAILAYVLFGKPFGTIMAVFKIWLLVATPVLMEIREWVRERRQWLGQRRAHVTMALFGLLLAWLLIPQSYRLSLPAVLAPAEGQWVHSPRAAIIVEAPSDDMAVAKGQNILVIRDPELDHAIAQSKRRLEMIKLVLRQTASTQMAARQQAVIDQELAQEQTALDGLLNQKRMLTVAAPFGGRITEINPLLRPGHWTDPDQPLFMVVGGGQDRLLAYVYDRDRSLIQVGGKARFYPESPDFLVMEGVVAHVQVVPAEYLAEHLLASTHGGEIPAREDQQKRLVPEHSLYQVSIIVPGLKEGASGLVLRGTVQCDSKPYSLAGLILDRFRALFARETGF